MFQKTFRLLLLLSFALSACTATPTAAPPTATVAPKSASPTPKSNSPTATTSSTTSSANCVNSAAFLSDVTVPDNANFAQGKTFTKTWRVKNTGTCDWTDSYTLTFLSGEQMGAPSSTPLSETKPGKTLDISIEMTAPKKDNAYRADFELRDSSGQAMPVDNGVSLWVIITVGQTTATMPSEPIATVASNQPGAGSASCALSINPANVSAAIAEINAYRAQNNLPALTVNAALTSAAQAHSDDMACNALFVHKGSDGSTPQSRAAAAGYSGTVTENVYGRNPAPTGREVVVWWATDQTDPRHNENLLTTKYTEIGAGYSFFNDFGYYTVVFGAP
ncbi:MAG: hypothetical protein IT310_03415 [Anaerolineales bacterium]|nr:hypothetical protein [Anaerolineales bacterium]